MRPDHSTVPDQSVRANRTRLRGGRNGGKKGRDSFKLINASSSIMSRPSSPSVVYPHTRSVIDIRVITINRKFEFHHPVSAIISTNLRRERRTQFRFHIDASARHGFRLRLITGMTQPVGIITPGKSKRLCAAAFRPKLADTAVA